MADLLPLNEIRLGIGADHAAVRLKSYLIDLLTPKVASIRNFGTDTTDSVDYPDFAHPLCQALEAGELDYGILLCGSGVGISIAANRHPGIRAILAWNSEIAALGRGHNNGNVLCLGARFIAEHHAGVIAETFLKTPFDEGVHVRRLEKLAC